MLKNFFFILKHVFILYSLHTAAIYARTYYKYRIADLHNCKFNVQTKIQNFCVRRKKIIKLIKLTARFEPVIY